MSNYEHHADIEHARQVTQADHEGRASDAEYEATKHAVKVTTVTRRAHDIERTIYVVRCGSCTFRQEHHDGERATREALRHEGARDYDDARKAGEQHVTSAAADVVAGVSGE